MTDRKPCFSVGFQFHRFVILSSTTVFIVPYASSILLCTLLFFRFFSFYFSTYPCILFIFSSFSCSCLFTLTVWYCILFIWYCTPLIWYCNLGLSMSFLVFSISHSLCFCKYYALLSIRSCAFAIDNQFSPLRSYGST